MHIRQMRGCN